MEPAISLTVFTRDPHLFVFYTRAIQLTLSEYICLMYILKGLCLFLNKTLHFQQQHLYYPECKRFTL